MSGTVPPGARRIAALDATRLSQACESAEFADTASPIASPTGVGSPSEHKPAGTRAGWGVVRRCEPPAQPAASDPSEAGGAAPAASTGDTSLLERAQPGVRELLLGALCRQASSCCGLAVKRTAVTSACSSGPGDVRCARRRLQTRHVAGGRGARSCATCRWRPPRVALSPWSVG
jgi:hypothetical protein